MEKQPTITALENLDDLDLLMQGDAVQIVYQNEPMWKHDEEEHLGAYHGKTSLGLLQFLVPAKAKDEYIIMYRARKGAIQLRDGKIVLNVDKSVTESFSQANPDYEKINMTLKNSGLR